jgi:hypothetical protein
MRRLRVRPARQVGTDRVERGANAGRSHLPLLAQRQMFPRATPVRYAISAWVNRVVSTSRRTSFTVAGMCARRVPRGWSQTKG